MEPVVTSKKPLAKWFLWFVTMAILTATIAFTTLGVLVLTRNTIYPNILIESVDVGGLTKAEARVKLEDIFEKDLQDFNIKLSFNEYVWEFPYQVIGFSQLYDDAIEEAYSIGRGDNYLDRFKEIISLRKQPVIVPLKTTYDIDKFSDIVEELKGTVEKSPVDATIKRAEGSFVITEEVNGITIDQEELIRRIDEGIRTINEDQILIPVNYIKPTILADSLSAVKEVVGEFFTVFNAEVTGRSTNISIASSSINGVLLMPNDTFSFNNQTGPRGIKEGYQEAPVIVNGKLVPGVGGGICQVSSTLYNAVVRADLQVLKRQNHSLPVAYVPLGHDATVFYGYIDFEFQNNKPYPIYLESFAKGNRVFVRIYSTKTDDMVIRLLSEVIETIEPKVEIRRDPTLPMGERKIEKEAKRGYKVKTYKVYSSNGKEIKREEISEDFYPPVHGIIFEGTSPLAPRTEAEEISPEEAEGEESQPVEATNP